MPVIITKHIRIKRTIFQTIITLSDGKKIELLINRDSKIGN